MPLVPADLRIESRWIAPMTARNVLLEHHSLLVRDGRILDVLPTAAAIGRYAPTAVLERDAHLLMPGMINAHCDAAAASLPQFSQRDVLIGIAQMLKSGVTCFVDPHSHPDLTARAAREQGLRAIVGMPVTEAAASGPGDAAQSLTRSLSLRDRYRDDPLVSTVFAPRTPNALSDETFTRLVTLADELDAGIMLELHRSQAQIDECLAAHGLRPIERLWKLGLLTPALNAVHAVHLNAADIALAQRTGISISLCPQSNLRLGDGLPPLAALAAAHIRLGVGGGGGAHLSQDLWGNIKLIALMMQGARAASGTERATGDESGSERGDESGSERGAGGDAALCAWEALRLATHGGAMVLGKEAEIGTLEGGKWADVCCVDLSGPNAQPLVDPLEQLVFGGGRDSVSDVWVAGRQLLSGGELTRLDWPALTRAPLRSAANSGS